MPLSTRIIPTLLNRRGSLVKGQRFNNTRVIGHVRQAARVFQSRNVDELFLLDIAGDEPDLPLIRDIAEECFMPLAVGGGISTLDHIQQVLANGADKVVLHSAALARPAIVDDAAHRFGSQAIVVAINLWGDLRLDARDAAKRYEAAGAGEILLQSVTRDGTRKGYDLDLIALVADAVSIPVVASGGCGRYEHMLSAILAGAHAVAAGAMWHFTDATPRGAASFLQQHGVNARVLA